MTRLKHMIQVFSIVFLHDGLDEGRKLRLLNDNADSDPEALGIEGKSA